MKKLAILILILPFLSVDASEPIALGQVFCNAGQGNCANAQTRTQWVIAQAGILTGCSGGFETGCAQKAGNIYKLDVMELGTPSHHNCYKYHFEYIIGALSIIDPVTGASGVAFTTSGGTQNHCAEFTPKAGCGGQQN